MRRILLLFILATTFISYSQVNWENNFNNNRSFIENIGQFDQFSNDQIGVVKYCADFGDLRILFGTKGVKYYYLIAEPKSEEEIEGIMAMSPEAMPHAEKEELISKFEFEIDDINMQWVNANANLELTGEQQTIDYHSYSVKDHSTGKVTNYNHAKGYRYIVYNEIYPNIDIKYEMHETSGVKYSVILHPGADPANVRMLYDRNISLSNNKIHIPTVTEDIIEHEPNTFYGFNQNSTINSTFTLQNNEVGFHLANYNSSQEVIIDPWVQTSTFTTSSAVWEVETDGSGNVYVIGGETPMQLKKFNSGGTLQWTYTTPWDTASVWLGTLATDINGNSFITSGTSPEIERVNTSGTMIWHANGGFSGGLLTEYWSISFNCDNTRLIVGGTSGGLNPTPAIYDMDISNGSVNAYQTFTPGSLFSPTEVRSISWSKNAKYIYLTHKQVGAINQNIGFCPTDVPIYEVPNNTNLSYKCENYLPATQNGGGLKALVANDNYFYTHEGNKITRWDLANGALINTVALPGGSASSGFGGSVVKCSGLSVDDCGNIYAGSMDRVVKFDANLNYLTEAAVNFNVYDVCVNSNTEVLAVGAQQNNGSASRNGRIQSVALSSCAKYALVCCDANICPAGPFCETDAPEALITYTPGGTWSGTGVNASGVFDPSVAGVGNWPITYTLPCGSETIVISVIPCNAPLAVCEETNGTLTASGGDANYSWYDGTATTSTISITNASTCNQCGGTPIYGGFFGFYNHCEDGLGNTITDCTQSNFSWNGTPYATGINTAAPASYPILIIDGSGDSLIINNAGELSACTPAPLSVNLGEFELSCVGSGARLGWSTVTETNCDHFVIERAYADGVFTPVGTVEAQGNSNSETFYSYTDGNRLDQMAFYRLSEVDYSGIKTLMTTQSIDCTDDNIMIYPNPFNSDLTIQLGDYLQNMNGILEFYQYNGQLVDAVHIPKNTSKMTYDASSLDKGVYIVKIRTDNSVYVEKLIKR